MAFYKNIPLDCGKIGIWKLEESSEELSGSFSEEELSDSDFRKYSYEKRKTEWLAARILVRHLIGADFKILYSETGKPILIHPEYKSLSISHSRDYVAVILHKTKDVGIDLEGLTRNYNSIQRRYLSGEELAQTKQDPVLQCLYWCAKEAIFKLLANDGIDFREQIRIFPFDPQLSKHFSAEYRSQSKLTSLTLDFLLFENQGLVWVVAP